MLALHRASREPESCPASGQIVALDLRRAEAPGVETGPCPVCGRALTVRGKQNRAGEWVGRVPSHRPKGLRDIERAAEARGRARCRADEAERRARARIRSDACRVAPIAQRARRRAGELPEPERSRRMGRVDVVEATAARACARRKVSDMPRDPARLLRALASASNLDLGAVEPDTFLEYLSGVLPARAIERMTREPVRRHVRLGIEAVLRFARPKTWVDLEQKSFAGQHSVLAVLRAFPGLEGLRLPERGYEALAEAAWAEEVPF